MNNVVAIIRKNIVLFLVLTIAFIALYYLALIQSAPFGVFIRSNSELFVSLQIIFSILNSLAGAVSVLYLLELYKIQKTVGKTNAFQSVSSLFISVATTGCYVCGSILLPGLGIASSFAAMPFGGLEVKVLTFALMLYSVSDLQSKLLGTCKIYTDSFIRLSFSKNHNYLLNTKPLLEQKSAFITFGFIALIFTLPLVLPLVSTASINDPNEYVCVEHV